MNLTTDVVNIGLGFIEGFALIISPCILPILPVVLSASLTGSKQRPLGIISGFIVTFALITFFARQLVLHTGIDLSLVRYLSYVFLLIIGVVLLSEYLSEKLTLLLQGLGNVGANIGNKPGASFGSGLLLGALIGIVWTPCAGPILAAVIVQTVLQKTTFTSFLIILAFGIGAGLPMLIIAFLGREVMEKFSFFKHHTQLLRRLIGLIIIMSVAYMIYSEKGTAAPIPVKSSTPPTTLENKLAKPYPAPAIAGISDWINSSPLQLKQLRGNVVLIDFWTYSCINCIRTLPYLKDWYKSYHDQGLVIIGVHSPEFAFEQDYNNVKNAVANYGILYPVALDNKFTTWENFHNQYWPSHYLIDKEGNVVYEHFGEGDYGVTENNIRALLGMKPTTATVKNPEFATLGETPETYLGHARTNQNTSPKILKDINAEYRFPEQLNEHAWALQGQWNVGPNKITTTKTNATIKIHFNAAKVFVVMGTNTVKPIKVNVLLNGEKLIAGKGKDVKDSNVEVKSHRLYEIVAMPRANNGILQLISPEPGLELYTFTFGS